MRWTPRTPSSAARPSRLLWLTVIGTLVLLASPLGAKEPLANELMGTAYYVPDMNVLNPEALLRGSPVFSDLADSGCILSEDSEDADDHVTFMQDSRAFASYVSSQTSLKAGFGTSVFALSTTANNEYSEARVSNYRIRSLAADRYSFSKQFQLDMNCLGQLDLSSELLEDFRSLPATIERPHRTRSWDDYQQFLEKHGSHFLKTAYTGSRMVFTAYSKESSHFRQSDLTARLCLSVEGGTPWRQGAFESCSGYNEAKRRASTRLDIVVRRHFMGGSSATRNALLSRGASPERLNKFYDEANRSRRPVKVEFHPIWDLLKERAKHEDDRLRALNLEAYFAGFKGYPCEYRHSRRVVLQRFVVAPEDRDSDLPFICERPCNGCQNSDTDCHIGGFGSVCYCYGPSCITTHRDGLAWVQYGESGSYDEGVNNTCNYQVGVYCSCDGSGKQWKTVWPESESCR